MQVQEVDGREVPGNSMLDEIRRTAEHRLQEIEPLIAEAEQLRDVLLVIDPQPAPAGEEKATNGTGNGNAHATHAPRGANKRIILELVAARPGITRAQIAQASGIKVSVVRSTVSRLKRHGALEEPEDGDLRVAAR
jgi:DNA-directed RNA polymerase specialized sigma24 family protein